MRPTRPSPWAPANLYAIGARGTVLQLEGKAEQSLAMLRKQVALNRNYAPAWHRISYALLTLGQPEAALEAGNEAIRLVRATAACSASMSSWQRPVSTWSGTQRHSSGRGSLLQLGRSLERHTLGWPVRPRYLVT